MLLSTGQNEKFYKTEEQGKKNIKLVWILSLGKGKNVLQTKERDFGLEI